VLSIPMSRAYSPECVEEEFSEGADSRTGRGYCPKIRDHHGRRASLSSSSSRSARSRSLCSCSRSVDSATSDDRTCCNLPSARCGVARPLEVTTLQPPADGPLGGPENAGGLLDGVGLLLHMGILPSEWGFALVRPLGAGQKALRSHPRACGEGIPCLFAHRAQDGAPGRAGRRSRYTIRLLIRRFSLSLPVAARERTLILGGKPTS
jgi:hypothetical protein